MFPGRNLKSYLLRFRRSSLRELIYRLRQELLVSRLRRRNSLARLLPKVSELGPDALAALQLPEIRGPINPEILEFSMGGGSFGVNGDRRIIERFEEESRGRFFADLKIGADSPDIRTAWEPARLQHITALLFAANFNGHLRNPAEALEKAKEFLFNWLGRNPFPLGPHYISPMECGLRIPVFVYALKILNLSADERKEVLAALNQHAWWISRRLSLYSSRGNHTICECLGLVFAGMVFRPSTEGNEWLSRGLEILRKEILNQILPDGGPAEQSLGYHRFILDIYWLILDFLKKNGMDLLLEFDPHLVMAERFLEAFGNGNGLPAIGDSDDGWALAPGLHPLRQAVYEPRQTKKNLAPLPAPTQTRPIHLQKFITSGYSVVRSGVMFFTFDHGSLGLPPLYNHGHADALSVTLSLKGRGVLVDPGTFRYNQAPEWRRYFKGTRAHNTVTIDQQDQAVQESGFIWSHPYRATLLGHQTSKNKIHLEGKHDGYTRLKKPVIHRRSICLEENRILIQDRFSGSGHHRVELNYHLHPECTLEMETEAWVVRHKEASIQLRLLNGDTLSPLKGEENPIGGWYSPAYGSKTPSFVLRCVKEGSPGDITFETLIRF